MDRWRWSMRVGWQVGIVIWTGEKTLKGKKRKKEGKE